VKFAYPELEEQLTRVPQALRAVLEDFESWSKQRGMPEPFITCIFRTPSQNKAAGGVAHSLHLIGRAVDLRNVGPSEKEPHYSAEERMACEAWLRRRCPKWAYELVLASHGTGPHWHLGFKLPELKNKNGSVA
jgi:hypothetical protein